MPWVASLPYGVGVQPARVADSKIRFSWATDSHAQTFGTTYMDHVLAWVKDCNEWLPDFCVHTGDLGSNSVSSVYYTLNALRRIRRPLLVVWGNHDEEELTLGPGHPNTRPNEAFNMFDQGAPFYRTDRFASGDGTLSALVITLDLTYYGDDSSPVHTYGDRCGFHTDELVYGGVGGYTKMIGHNQLAWTESALAADNSDMVLVMLHQRPNAVANGADLQAVMDADGRPMALFCGHNHGHATTTAWGNYNIYKMPGMVACGAWARVILSLVAGEIVVEQMEMHNYTNPGSDTIDAPFTVAA